MFSGKAEEAINLYTSLFNNSQINHIKKYGANEGGPEGTVMHASFVLDGTEYMAIDSPIEHAFSFTPAISIYVTCTSEEEVDHLFSNLSIDGQVLMPLDAYPFSKRFGWIADRYGVSWQLAFS